MSRRDYKFMGGLLAGALLLLCLGAGVNSLFRYKEWNVGTVGINDIFVRSAAGPDMDGYWTNSLRVNFLNATSTITGGGNLLITSGSATVASGGTYGFSGKGSFSQPVSGVFQVTEGNGVDAYGLLFGGVRQSNGLVRFVSTSIGNTQGVFQLRSGNTNLWFDLQAGGVAVGPGTQAFLTNTLYASETKDFPTTPAGVSSDLVIAVAGAADGDIVTLGVPTGSIGPLNGTYVAWASNGAVYIRYSNQNLVTENDPVSGTFKVRVDKFR